jgi:HNH endonuclease/NUMOD3 motif
MREYVEFKGRKYFKRTNGYYESKRPCTQLHRDVWEHYNGLIPKGYVIHHIDHNPSNYDITNLEMMKWGAHNRGHALTQGTSDETRKKMSDSHKGQEPWNKGKELPPHSEEHKKKLSEALRKPITPDMIEDVKNGMKLKVFQAKYNNQSAWSRIRKELGIKGHLYKEKEVTIC